MSDVLLSIGDVCTRLGCSRTTFFERRRADPTFPAPTHCLGRQSPRWWRSEVDAWIEASRASSSAPTPAAA